MTTLFRGVGLFQILLLMLLLSGLWGPLLRSMYIKENQKLECQFILGMLKIVLAVVFRTTKLGNNVFGLILELGNKCPRLRPHQFWSFRPKLMFSL